jgi:hypothetical protein
MVGVIFEFHGLDSIDSKLTVLGVVSGRVLHTFHAYSAVGYGDRFVTYVLARSGNTAWATVTTSSGPHGNFVHTWTIRVAIGTTVSTLDTGPRVRARSLRRRGATVEWIDGGMQRTAPLP